MAPPLCDRLLINMPNAYATQVHTTQACPSEPDQNSPSCCSRSTAAPATVAHSSQCGYMGESIRLFSRRTPVFDLSLPAAWPFTILAQPEQQACCRDTLGRVVVQVFPHSGVTRGDGTAWTRSKERVCLQHIYETVQSPAPRPLAPVAFKSFQRA